MLNKISSFVSILSLTAFLFLFSANDVFAQKRQMPPGNSTIPILSETAMKSLVLQDLDAELVKKYLGIIVCFPKEVISAESTEARVAATLVSSLSKEQLAVFSQTFNAKQKDNPNLVECEVLNYPSMWGWMGLCNE
ncbi:MAG: hypothetical protein AB8B69_08410 [Chitinophagales bacterium]